MNILIVTDYYPPDKLGGVGEIAKNLKLHYQAKGHNTWVLTTGVTNTDNRIVRSSKSLIRGVFINNFLAIKMIHTHKIDVVNLHQSATTLFLLTKYIPFILGKFPRVVNSYQVSYLSEFSNIHRIHIKGNVFRPTGKEYIEKWLFAPIHILLEAIGFMLSDEVTVVSHAGKREFERTYGRLSYKPIKVIPNGIASTEFGPKASELSPLHLDMFEGKTVLLYVGVFRVRKRVFNLLYAFAEVLKRNPRILLVLIGGGRGYERSIHRLIDMLNINRNVLIIGPIPNKQVVHYLNSADIFCLLSSYEGMPVSILEAMSCGKAILTSRVCGMIDLIENGRDGYLTEVDNLEDIQNSMHKLVENPNLTKQMGENARNKILTNYDWGHIANQYVESFQP